MYKILLLLAVVAIAIRCNAQQKKTSTRKQQAPAAIKYRDSIYYDTFADTLHGVISYPAGEGIVRGEGMVIHWQVYKMHTTIPQRNSYFMQGKDTIWFGGGSVGMETNKGDDGYIKTKSGWKRLDYSCKFTLIPD